MSHGQAMMERGFSVSKKVETCNMQEDAMIVQQLVSDFASVCGGVLKVPISKELLASAAPVRSRYRVHLDEQKRKKITDAQAQKQKAAEETIEQLRMKKQTSAGVHKPT